MFLTGEFAIKPDKKSEAVVKKAKKVGMIAGGTGEWMKSLRELLLIHCPSSLFSGQQVK